MSPCFPAGISIYTNNGASQTYKTLLQQQLQLLNAAAYNRLHQTKTIVHSVQQWMSVDAACNCAVYCMRSVTLINDKTTTRRQHTTVWVADRPFSSFTIILFSLCMYEYQSDRAVFSESNKEYLLLHSWQHLYCKIQCCRLATRWS